MPGFPLCDITTSTLSPYTLTSKSVGTPPIFSVLCNTQSETSSACAGAREHRCDILSKRARLESMLEIWGQLCSKGCHRPGTVLFESMSELGGQLSNLLHVCIPYCASILFRFSARDARIIMQVGCRVNPFLMMHPNDPSPQPPCNPEHFPQQENLATTITSALREKRKKILMMHIHFRT